MACKGFARPLTAAVLAAALSFAAAGFTPAFAAVTISTDGTQNISCSATVCSPTAADAILNIHALENLLAAGDIEITSGGSLAQDVIVAAGISWTSASKLTLTAYRYITINQPISVAGTGALDLEADTGNANGNITFGTKGHATFFSLHSELTIQKKKFTLINSISALATAIALKPDGYYALANSYDATPDGTYAHSPIPTEFGGIFDALGNTISNLSVNDTSANTGEEVGLFSVTQPGSYIRHLNLAKVHIFGAASSEVGGIVGDANGVLRFDFVSGTVRTGTQGKAGGLAGINEGPIEYSHSSATVISPGNDAELGGLAGLNYATVTNSYATGAVTGSGMSQEVGGLVGGQQSGTIKYSHATGAVTAQQSGTYVGGLVGDVLGGNGIFYCYATGPVTGGPLGVAGGLIRHGGAIDSFATGAVSGAQYSGGLIGSTQQFAIYNDYAMGAVSGEYAGGLVGINGGSIATSYSTESVSGMTDAGGLIGYDGEAAGQIASTYWDTTTSGITDKSQGAGNVANDPGITAQTTQHLKAGLPAGFDASHWAESATINGGLPYLLLTPPP